MKQIPPHLTFCLQEMLDDLHNEHFKVEKVPQTGVYANDDGREQRVLVSQNPPWYQDLAALNPKPEYRLCRKTGKSIKRRARKNPQTGLKKSHIVSTIEKMIKNLQTNSRHADFFLDVAQSKFEIYENACPF